MRLLRASTSLAGTAGAAILAAVVIASPAAADPSATPTEPAAPTSTEPEPTSTEPIPTLPAPTSTPSTSPTSTPSTSPTSTGPTPAPSGAHQVTYTVTTTSDVIATIYYVLADPPTKDAANDPMYMPMDRTTVGPGTPWTLQTTLDDPSQWAFVSASGGLRVNPEFHCEISVDGQVVMSQQGGSGVQCAMRPW